MIHDPISPHYVRFARSLALATTTLALAACSSTNDPTATPDETSDIASTRTDAGSAAKDASIAIAIPSSTDAAYDAGVDAAEPVAIDSGAATPHTSGPLPPPELPSEIA
jgi:hypothetical protein